MKKLFCTISAIIFSLTVCLSFSAALDEEPPRNSIKTLDQYGDLLIQMDDSTVDIWYVWLYDAKQDKELFRAKYFETVPNDETYIYQEGRLFFTEDGRILFSTWRYTGAYEDLIEDVQTFELSPDGTKKTLLTEEYGIWKQDIVGRFMCMTAGQSIERRFGKWEWEADYYSTERIDGVPLKKYGIFDANFDKILIPFDYTRFLYVLGDTNCIICGYPDKDNVPVEGVLNAATLEWIIPLQKQVPGQRSYITNDFTHNWIEKSEPGGINSYSHDGKKVEGQILYTTNLFFSTEDTKAYTWQGVPIPNYSYLYDLDGYPASWTQPSSWATEEIARADSLGLVPGPPDPLDKLYQYPISRRNFSYLLINILEKINPKLIENTIEQAKKIKFFDAVTEGSYDSYVPFNNRPIHLATALGIVTGYADKTFRPENCITRQEAAAMLNRMIKVLKLEPPEVETTDYTDADKISSWATEDVKAVSAAGVMNGVGKGKFDPEGTYTLEQSILTMLRIYDLANSQPDATYLVTDDTETVSLT